MDLSPHKDDTDLVFRGKDRSTPMRDKEIEAGLYNAFVKIGVSAAERRKRNLTFHSWRHWWNTELVLRRIDPAKVQMFMGHKSTAVTQHYTHYEPRDLEDIRKVQESIFVTA